MWISIRSKRINLSQRLRRHIEAYVQRAFQRERRQIASAVISIEPAKLGGDLLGFKCQIRLWSSYLSLVAVSDAGDTVRTAVQQASLRARNVVRRRLQKRRVHQRRSAIRPFRHRRLGPGMPGFLVE